MKYFAILLAVPVIALRLGAVEPLRVETKPLAEFDPSDWAAVEKAFDRATPIPMGQAWRAEKEKKFRGATVRTGWRGDSIWIFAELEDASIANPATRLNEIEERPATLPADEYFDPLLTTRGDVFEVFMRNSKNKAYIELHVTPNNQALQLHWTGPEDYQQNVAQEGKQIGKRVIEGEKVFKSWVRVEVEKKRWFVLVEIPSQLVNDAGFGNGIVKEKVPGIEPGDEWRFSFCRYDCTEGVKREVLASTSPHAEAGFHRCEEWGTLKFAP